MRNHPIIVQKYGGVCLETPANYRDSFRIGHFPAEAVNEAETWNPRTNALRFVSGGYSSEWSYKGDTMH
jgi:hypothetical protein